MTKTQAIEQLTAAIRAEIEQDPELLACRSFSALHDVCDANMLGGEVIDAIDRTFPWDDVIDILGAAQDAIHAWLVERKGEEAGPA